ncbi:hypothetical protein OUZ56_000795 [Daphnia magna]|uniref:Uncharacterized protein n=1 Tax=Daphnia magna TaxID=35525 RepID=A0ABR0A0S3_9CRUS|nr:hypothetical protein OUZ56_000795 [Daphnia magna]
MKKWQGLTQSNVPNKLTSIVELTSIVVWAWDNGSVVSHDQAELTSVVDSGETDTCVEASMPSACGGSPLSESTYIEDGNVEASTSIT